MTFTEKLSQNKQLSYSMHTDKFINYHYFVLSRFYNSYIEGEYPTLVYPCRRAYRKVLT